MTDKASATSCSIFSTVTTLLVFGADRGDLGPDLATLAPWENALEIMTRDTTEVLRK
jgi:hypothetical protein